MYPGYEEDMAELKRLCEKALAAVNKLEANIDELIAEVEARSRA